MAQPPAIPQVNSTLVPPRVLQYDWTYCCDTSTYYYDSSTGHTAATLVHTTTTLYLRVDALVRHVHPAPARPRSRSAMRLGHVSRPKRYLPMTPSGSHAERRRLITSSGSPNCSTVGHVTHRLRHVARPETHRRRSRSVWPTGLHKTHAKKDVSPPRKKRNPLRPRTAASVLRALSPTAASVPASLASYRRALRLHQYQQGWQHTVGP
eukprot:3332313-Rhodomonas_salina.2